MAKKLISIDDVTGALPDLVNTSVDARVKAVGDSTYVRPTDAVLTDKMSRTLADSLYSRTVAGPLYGAFAKIGSAKLQRANIVVLGDSIAEGQSASAIDRRWTTRVQGALRAKYTNSATGGAGFIPARYAATPAGGGTFPGWTVSAGSPNVPHGLGYRGRQLNAAGQTATITQTCTSFEIHMRRNAVDSVTITIDGGAPVTWTLDTSKSAQKWTSPALSAGSHTIEVAYNAGGPSFCGGVFFNGDETAGLSMIDAASSGGRLSHLLETNTKWVEFVPLVSPSLMVITLATNDSRSSSGGYNAATYKTNMLAVIDLVRGQVPNLPILLMPPYKPLGATISPWADYITALREITTERSYVALYDMSASIPDLTNDPYGVLQDGVHPTDNGYAFMATLAEAALSPH